MATTQIKTRVLAPEDVKYLRYPLPESMKKAAGMLRGRKVNALRYQRQIRAEWEKRFKLLEERLHRGR